MNSKGKVALVTGASSGIGEAIAQHLFSAGYKVYGTSRRGDVSQNAFKMLPLDVTSDTSVAAAVSELIRLEGRIDLLVNNAGFGTTGPFARLDPDQEEAEILLNVLALVRLTRAALPGMLARGRGAIINVSSLAAFAPGPYDATYSATKAFVNSFTEALHEELCGTGVHVQTLCPGFTYTEFQQRAGIDIAKIPTFAWMGPEAVVEASLRALQRRQVVCVPGPINRLLALLMGAAPRRLVRHVAGILAHRVLGE